MGVILRGEMYIALKRVLVNEIEARLHGLEFNVRKLNWGRGPEEYPRCICGVRDECKIVWISRRSDRAMSFLYQRA